MVRFKNRHILVEFLDVSALSAFPPVSATSMALPADGDDEGEDDEGEDDPLDGAEDEVTPLPLPSAPFMLAQAPSAASNGMLGEEGSGIVYKAVRENVMTVFGDEGWGRVGSSFRVIYHSPLTTLTILRVARPHYRLIWGGLTLLTNVNGTPVLPRVIAVSGTIKKLQSAAIMHHRRVTAAAVATLVAQGAKGEAEKERLEAKYKLERESMGRLED